MPPVTRRLPECQHRLSGLWHGCEAGWLTVLGNNIWLVDLKSMCAICVGVRVFCRDAERKSYHSHTKHTALTCIHYFLWNVSCCDCRNVGTSCFFLVDSQPHGCPAVHLCWKASVAVVSTESYPRSDIPHWPEVDSPELCPKEITVFVRWGV